MKYKIILVEDRDETTTHIGMTSDDINFTTFPAEVGNPNYVAFLEQAGLTDDGVQALDPDIWHDFPEVL